MAGTGPRARKRHEDTSGVHVYQLGIGILYHTCIMRFRLGMNGSGRDLIKKDSTEKEDRCDNPGFRGQK